MKIVFVYRYANYEPLGIMTLSAALKAAGHQCALVDLRFERSPLKTIQSLAPDIVAYSLITGSHTFYRDFNLRLKKHFQFISVFGGPHCTYFPGFIHEEGVDILCRGEAENAFVELANALQQQVSPDAIPNLWIKKKEGIIENEIRPLQEDLDSIPFPDRDLVNVYRAYRKMKRRDVIASRGCPYSCTYCFNNAGKELFSNKGKYVRQRSTANVIAELKHLKEYYGSRVFHFQDDVFTLNKVRLLDFCTQYEKEIALPFEVQLRVNMVDEEIVQALKKAGCTLVMYGIESGDERMRKEILGRDISDEQILQAAALFRKYRIRTMSVNMIGLPGETRQMATSTLRLNIRCRPSYAWNAVYQPYPMTRLSELSVQQGYFDGNFDAFKGSFIFGGSLLKMPDIRTLVRLHYLFPLAVAFPLLSGFFIRISSIPAGSFYRLLFSLHRLWAAFFSLRRIRISEIVLFEKRKFFFVKRSW